MTGRRKKRGQAPYRSGYAVLYARYSPRPKKKVGENEVDCESADTQLSLCREYCAKHGLKIRAEEKDEGKSGADALRSGLALAMAALRPGDVLVAYSIDRLHRKLEAQLAFQRRILELDCFLASANGDQIAIETPHGRLVASILGAFAEYQREAIGKVTSAHKIQQHHMRRAASKDAPYGWTIIRIPGQANGYRDAKLVPNLLEQRGLRRMFELIDDGVSRTEFRKILEREGIRQRNGKQFAWEQLHRIEDRGKVMIATNEELENAVLPAVADDEPGQCAAEPEADRDAVDLVECAGEQGGGLGAAPCEVPAAQS